MPKLDAEEVQLRKPTKDDGSDVWELVKHTGVLDLNSSYSYLIWCDLYSETSIVATHNGHIVGFISGFIHPKKPDTLFIWQVAVHESQRGKGIGTKMLFELLDREASCDVQYIETTISPSNIASQHLFYGLADKAETECVVGNYIVSIDFPRTGHEDELLYKIGPIASK